MVEQGPEYKKFIYGNLKKNTFVCTVNGCIGSLGAGMVPLGTVLTFYIAYYTTSNAMVGLVNFLSPLLANFPQVFLAKYMAKFSCNKWLMVANGIATRAVWIILGVTTLTLQNSFTNLMVFLLIYSVYNFGMGFQTLCWNDMVSKLVPDELKGRFVGIRSFFAGTFEFIATLLLGFILNEFVFPQNYAYVFFISGILSVVSAALFAFLREPETECSADSVSYREYFGHLKQILVQDRNFTSGLVHDYFAILSRTVGAFLIVYGKVKLDITPNDMVLMTVVVTVSQTVFYLIWGYFNDRYGYKPSLIFSTFGYVLANLGALLFLQNVAVLMLLFALTGAAQSARNVGRINLIMKFAGENNVRPYIALNNMILTVPFGVFPLLWGIIIDHWGYTPFFIVNAVSGLIAVYVMRYKVDEDRIYEVKEDTPQVGG